jgi:maltose/moltooligosaccharide transporter
MAKRLSAKALNGTRSQLKSSSIKRCAKVQFLGCGCSSFLILAASAITGAGNGVLWKFCFNLDVGNNTAMEPYRAFIADTLKPAQQPTGFQAQSFFTGFGQTFGKCFIFLFR